MVIHWMGVQVTSFAGILSTFITGSWKRQQRHCFLATGWRKIWMWNWTCAVARKWSIEYWNTGYMLIGCGWEGAGDVTLNDCCVLSCFCYSLFFFGLGILNYDCIQFSSVCIIFPWSISCNMEQCGLFSLLSVKYIWFCSICKCYFKV